MVEASSQRQESAQACQGVATVNFLIKPRDDGSQGLGTEVAG